MQRSHLFDLILAVQAILSDEVPVIVGSQATHALSTDPPEIALESIECDFILFGGKAEERERINSELGVFSPFQREHGYYADALGLATVVLPSGWQDRLQPLHDSEGNIVAHCLEIHDLAVSKVIAGREKDLEFLEAALASGLIRIDELLRRLDLAAEKVENDVISDRLGRLIDFLTRKKTHHGALETIKEFTRR